MAKRLPHRDPPAPTGRGPSATGVEPPSPRRRGRTVIAYALVFVAAAAFFAAFQFQTKNLVGFDGYYHIKYSYVLRTQGWQWNLPWLHYTIYRDFYRDHHFLFHLLLMPFTLGGTPDSLRWGAKVAATLFPTLMAVSFFALLRAVRVPRPGLWMIALAGSGTAFLYRMTMPRPMAGAVALLLLAALLLSKERYRGLAVLTAVGVWYYDGYGMIVLLALTFFVAHWLVERRPNWRPLVWCLAGALAGIVLNPYFPRNIQSYLFNLYRSFSGMETAMGGGSEWRPLDAWRFVAGAPGGTLALLVAAVAGRWCRRPRADTVALILIAAVAFLMACRARRYMEYYPPLALLAAALTVRDLAGSGAGEGGVGRTAGRRSLLLSIVMAATAALTVPRLRSDIVRTQPYLTFKGAAEYMAKESKPGDVVFNTAYDDFPQLFFYNQRNHYIVGLDPIYLYRHNATLFELWRAVGRGALLDAHEILSERCKGDEDLLALLEDVHERGSVQARRTLEARLKDEPGATDLVQHVFEKKPLTLHYVLTDIFKATWAVMEKRKVVAFEINRLSDPSKRLIQVQFAGEYCQVYRILPRRPATRPPAGPTPD